MVSIIDGIQTQNYITCYSWLFLPCHVFHQFRMQINLLSKLSSGLHFSIKNPHQLHQGSPTCYGDLVRYTNIYWLVVSTNPSEKYEFVSWGYDIPNWMESHTIPWFQTTNQNTTNQNMLVRLGWWHSQLLGKIKNSMVPNHKPDTNGYLLAITICLFNIAMENHHSPVGFLNFSPITPYK